MNLPIDSGAALSERISKLVRTVLQEFPRVPDRGVMNADANAAFNVLEKILASNSLHLADLEIRTNRQTSMMHAHEIIESERAKTLRLQRTVNFLSQHVGEALKRQAKAAKEIDWNWLEFEDAVVAQLGVLRDGWIDAVAKHLVVKRSEVRRWEMGIEAVPDWAFESVKTMTKASLKATSSAPERVDRRELDRNSTGTKSVAFPWSENPKAEVDACQRFIYYGQSLTEIAQYVETAYGIKMPEGLGPLKQRMHNAGPPPAMKVGVKKSGPTSWAELWEIGAKLTKNRAWQQFIRNRLQIDPEIEVGCVLDGRVDPALLKQLRLDYFANRMSNVQVSYRPTEGEVLQVVQDAGPRGVTKKELTALHEKYTKRKYIDGLLDEGKVIINGFRDGFEVYVLRSYAH